MEKYTRHKEWLAGLKPGDEVAIDNGHSGLDPTPNYTLHKVTKITNQHGGTIYVDDRRFDQVNGYRRGESGYRFTSLEEPTPELLAEMDRVKLVRRVRDLLYEASKKGALTEAPIPLLETLAEALKAVLGGKKDV